MTKTRNQDSTRTAQDTYLGIYDIARAIQIMDRVEKDANLSGFRPSKPNLVDSPCARKHSPNTRAVCVAMDMRGMRLAGEFLVLFGAKLAWNTIWRCLYFELPLFVAAVDSRSFLEHPYLQKLGEIIDRSKDGQDPFTASFEVSEAMEVLLAGRYGWSLAELVMP